MSYPLVTLKEKKDIPLQAGHPWVFSNAIQSEPQPTPNPGELVEVASSTGVSLGIGTFNPQTSIRVRMLERDASKTIDKHWFAARFKKLDAWKRSHLPEKTDGYRLVHSESDGIPGLIVDRYNDVFVYQIHTAGMERLREEIIEGLETAFDYRAIVERSDVEARVREGLSPLEPKLVRGTLESKARFMENGLTFEADVMEGQKTGFFLDQRDARLRVGALAKGKRVLNLFGYTGAFSVHAAKGDAKFVATVDLSEKALEQAEENLKLNGFDAANETTFAQLQGDVLDMLQDDELEGGPYDLIICDPPAFAKTEEQIDNANKAYTDLNRQCLEKLEVGGILVTSSCSGRIEPEDFRKDLRIAAGRAKREVRLLGFLGHDVDHAELLSYPEGRYLKTAILEVTDMIG